MFIIPDDKIKHLYNRVGFGLRADGDTHLSLKEVQRHITQTNDKIVPLTVVQKPEPEVSDTMTGKPKFKDRFKRSKEEMQVLNDGWMERMRTTNNPLREKTTLFWHGHFACRSPIPYLAQEQNNTMRSFGLERFDALLTAASKNTAMLQFLNNQQNKKGHPNENFAREVMELFTLGRGNYTETDVKEAARAFTGWGFNADAEFVFRKQQHDDGSKSFRGKDGNFSGEDILNMILDDKQTARFISGKLFDFWVCDERRDPEIIESMAESFYKSGYDIGKLHDFMFSSDWFYEDRFTGNRIKSPVELLLSYQHHTCGTFDDPRSSIFLQRAMGQLLFFPPNVGGWPKGREWIDSSSLMFRLSLPNILLERKENDFEAKDDGDANNPHNQTNGKRDLSLRINWDSLAHRFTKKNSDETIEFTEAYLLTRPLQKTNRDAVAKRAGSGTTDPEFLRKAFAGFMSLPEYQLC
jgi:uncharacterized protein (DUF1800 family)